MMNAFLPYSRKPSGIPCRQCGGTVVEFTIPNDIWNAVIRPDGKEGDGEYICIGCWYERLRQVLGIQEVRNGTNLSVALLGAELRQDARDASGVGEALL